MTLAAVGAVGFVLAVLLMVLRKSWRRTQSLLMVVAGLSVSGALGGVRDHVSLWSQHASSSVTAALFGTAVPYAIGFGFVGAWFLLMDVDALVNKMRGKGGGKSGAGGDATANRFKTSVLTPLLGLVVPVALAALPGLAALPDQARDGVTALASVIG